MSGTGGRHYGNIARWQAAAYDQYSARRHFEGAVRGAPVRGDASTGDKGVCFGLSLLWCNEAANPSLNPAARTKALDYQKARTVFQVTQNGMTEDERTEALMAGTDLATSTTGSSQIKNTTDFSKIARFLPNLVSAELIADEKNHWTLETFLARLAGLPAGAWARTPAMLNIIGNGYGHSVALCCDSQGVVFFDSNCGEYQIPGPEFGRFIQMWVGDSNLAFGKGRRDSLIGYNLIQLFGRSYRGFRRGGVDDGVAMTRDRR